jgi:hypothetical protein
LREQRNAEADYVVIADRVRSSIGSLLTELDAPRIHVMAEGSKVRVGLLPGDSRPSNGHVVPHSSPT